MRQPLQRGTLFWNVDTQVDFMHRTGALYVPEAETIEPNLRRITALARERGIRVVNTADLHDPDAAEFSDHPDGVVTFPPHCVRGTEGAAFVPASRPQAPLVVDWKGSAPDPEALVGSREVVIYKDAFDVFAGNPHTERILSALHPEQVFVYGVAANFCVHDAVTGLVWRGFPVRVIHDAVKEIPVPDGPRSMGAVEAQWRRMGVQRIPMAALASMLTEKP